MRISENFKGLILAIMVITIFLYGYRYYRYTQDEPDFCTSCHVIKEAYTDWQKGRHKDVVCQKCHQLGNLEQNLRLVSYIVTGRDPITLTHGRTGPWQECESCHADVISQGSVSPSKAYGHARHVLSKKIECKSCHVSKMHNFPPDDVSCQKCHQDKGVHGIEMDEFSCIKCHAFSRTPLPMLSKDKCLKCHTGYPKKGPMSGLSCHYCHRPHKKEKPTPASCTAECHRTQASMGQHGLHMKQGIECMHCHRPHSWSVGQPRAKSLCAECHPFKDPKGFVYIF